MPPALRIVLAGDRDGAADGAQHGADSAARQGERDSADDGDQDQDQRAIRPRKAARDRTGCDPLRTSRCSSPDTRNASSVAARARRLSSPGSAERIAGGSSGSFPLGQLAVRAACSLTARRTRSSTVRAVRILAGIMVSRHHYAPRCRAARSALQPSERTSSRSGGFERSRGDKMGSRSGQGTRTSGSSQAKPSSSLPLYSLVTK